MEGEGDVGREFEARADEELLALGLTAAVGVTERIAALGHVLVFAGEGEGRVVGAADRLGVPAVGGETFETLCVGIVHHGAAAVLADGYRATLGALLDGDGGGARAARGVGVGTQDELAFEPLAVAAGGDEVNPLAVAHGGPSAATAGGVDVDGHTVAIDRHVHLVYGNAQPVGRHDAEEDVVETVELAASAAANAGRAGGKVAHLVEAVAVAAPAPVHVETQLGIVTVTHPCVTSAVAAATAAVVHRISAVQLGFEILRPLVVAAEGGPVDEPHVGVVIAEEVDKGGTCVVAVGTAATVGADIVAHIDSHAAMIHQGGYCVNLHLRAGAREGCRHVCPVVGSGSEVGTLGSVTEAVVGVRTDARGGILPVVHHLGHSGGHAACYGVLVVLLVIGAEVVVVGRLVPRSLHQRPYAAFGGFAFAVLLKAGPCTFDRGRGLCTCGTQGGNLFVVAREPETQLGREAVGLHGATHRIAKDGERRIVGGHHDEGVVGHKEIDRGHAEGRTGVFEKGGAISVLLEKMTCHSEGSLWVYRGRLDVGGGQHGK